MKRPMYSWQTILCLIGLLLTASGCSHNQSPQTMEGTPRESQSQGVLYTLRDYTIPQSAIEQDALSLMNAIAPSYLREAERRIAEVIPLQSDTSLRSTDPVDTAPLAYVVNFADNKGYVVLSSDIRLNPVWAVSTVGNLDVDKEPDNPTAKMLLQQVEIAYNINRYAVTNGILDVVDHLGSSDGKPIRIINIERDFTKVEYGPWERIPSETYEALIPVVWGQSRDPYNRYAPTGTPAGCVTTAVAQIMAFHRYPFSYNWGEMLKYHPLTNPSNGGDFGYSTPARNEIARLYRDLGASLRIKYDKNGSGTSDEYIPKTFYRFGYSNCSKPGAFSIDKIRDEFKKGNGYPVYISAFDKKIVHYYYFLWINWTKDSYDGGHAFVIDGACQAKRLVRTLDSNTGKEISRRYQYTNLLHANLGWDNPWYNGYYHASVFNTESGPILKEMSKATQGVDGVFRYNFHIITGIRP